MRWRFFTQDKKKPYSVIPLFIHTYYIYASFRLEKKISSDLPFRKLTIFDKYDILSGAIQEKKV